MKVELLKSEHLLDGFFKVEKAILKHEKYNGSMSEIVVRYNLIRGEAVEILIYLEDTGQLVLVRQFRYAVHSKGENGWIIEAVAGVMDSDSPVDCARREILEETGFNIDRLQYVNSVYSTPGITTEKTHLFIATTRSENRAHDGGGLEHEHEDIEVVFVTPQQAKEMIERREIIDAKTIVLIQHFLLLHRE